jgi:predicted dinucleotide-binding enzyme
MSVAFVCGVGDCGYGFDLCLLAHGANVIFAARRADVAQLVEQRFRKPQVTGSNPVVGCLDWGLRIDGTLRACSRKLS